MRHFQIFIVAVAVFSSATAESARKWKTHGVDSGVTVFTSRVQGSDIPRVRAVAEVDATTDEVWRYITGPQFRMKGLKVKRTVGTCGGDCEFTYIRVGHPFMSDRHYVAKFENRVNSRDGANRYHRTWQPQNDRTPHDDDAVLVEKVAGSWTLEPINGGTTTRIVYEAHVDLEGAIPSSVFSKGFVSATYKLVKKVIANGPQL